MCKNDEYHQPWFLTEMLKRIKEEPNRLEIWAELGKGFLSIPDITYETIAEYLEIPEDERQVFYDTLTSIE